LGFVVLSFGLVLGFGSGSGSGSGFVPEEELAIDHFGHRVVDFAFHEVLVSFVLAVG